MFDMPLLDKALKRLEPDEQAEIAKFIENSKGFIRQLKKMEDVHEAQVVLYKRVVTENEIALTRIATLEKRLNNITKTASESIRL